MGTDTAKLETIRTTMEDRGVEFIFAQFVDMYGRPSAKLIPAEQLDDLVEDGAGFAGFAAGEIGQLPSDPDIAAMPDLDSFTLVPWQPNLARFACDVTVEGEAWPYCPAHDPAQRDRAGSRAGLRVQDRDRARVLPRAAQRRRHDRDRGQARHAREAVLRHGGADAPVRLPDDRLALLQRARLGQLRERPRGRERPVRAELRVRRGARQCDRAIFFRYMVHTLAEQYGRIATFMPKPFTTLTGNGCHFHMSLWKDGVNVFLDESDRARARPVRGGLRLHRRPEDARAGLQRAHRADRQLVQAPEAGLDLERCDVVAGVDLLRLQQPHADAADPGARPDRGSDGRRLVQPVPRGGRRARVRPRRHGQRNLDAGEPNSENLYSFSYEELTARGLPSLPANLLDATGELERDDVLRAALGRTRENEEYVDYYVRVKRDEWFRYHEQVSAWEVREYLTRF